MSSDGWKYLSSCPCEGVGENNFEARGRLCELEPDDWPAKGPCADFVFCIAFEAPCAVGDWPAKELCSDFVFFMAFGEPRAVGEDPP
jgi:hypothetical protein